MNILDKSSEQKKREQINNYLVSIQAIQSFISLITWDSSSQTKYGNSHYWIGRRMTPIISDTSEDELANRVTPDIVIQKGNIGYVVEVKKSICKNSEHWDEIVDQLEKYSLPLVGWWTEDERIESECLVLLINIVHSHEFTEYLEKKGISFEKDFSLIEFTKNDGVNESLFIRRHFGHIAPEDLNKYLSNGSQMPIEKIVGSYGVLKFYDAEPPVIEYMMLVLWQDIFNTLKVEEGTYNNKYSRWEFNVSVDIVTYELQKSFGMKSINDRDVSFPDSKWITKALNRYEEIGFAKKIDNGIYRIFYRQIRGDILEGLIKKVDQLEQLDDNGEKQLQLNL